MILFQSSSTRSFTDNKIHIGVLTLLNKSLINDLIKNIGEREIFLDYWIKKFHGISSNDEPPMKKATIQQFLVQLKNIAKMPCSLLNR